MPVDKAATCSAGVVSLSFMRKACYGPVQGSDKLALWQHITELNRSSLVYDPLANEYQTPAASLDPPSRAEEAKGQRTDTANLQASRAAHELL